MLLVRSVKIIALHVRHAFVFVNFKTIASHNNAFWVSSYMGISPHLTPHPKGLLATGFHAQSSAAKSAR